MPTTRRYLTTARNRLRRNGTSLDLALAQAELDRLPSRHVRTIQRLLADTHTLRRRLGHLVKRIRISSTPPPA